MLKEVYARSQVKSLNEVVKDIEEKYGISLNRMTIQKVKYHFDQFLEIHKKGILEKEEKEKKVETLLDSLKEKPSSETSEKTVGDSSENQARDDSETNEKKVPKDKEDDSEFETVSIG